MANTQAGSISTELRFVGKDDATPTLKKLSADLGALRKEGLSLSKVFGGTFLGMSAQQAVSRMASETVQLAKSFVTAANDTENLRGQLTLIAGSKADSILASIRSEIAQMPVSLNAATQAYTSLRAGGIEPAMKDLKAIADLAANMKGDPNATIGTLADSMARLSSMTELGSDSMNRYLLTLTQQGIPVTEILRDKLHLSAEAMADLGKAGVTGRDVVGAMLAWMRDQQGKTADGFDGLVQKMTNSWQELQRSVMDSGVFEAMKLGIKQITEYLSSMKGQLDIRSLMIDIGVTTIDTLKAMTLAAQTFYAAIRNISTLYDYEQFGVKAAFRAYHEKKVSDIESELKAPYKEPLWKTAFDDQNAGERSERLKRELQYHKAWLGAQEADYNRTVKSVAESTMPGEKTSAEMTFERMRESLDQMRSVLLSGSNGGPGGGAGNGAGAGTGLPDATRFAQQAGMLDEITKEALAGADKTTTAMLGEWTQQQQHASSEAIKIRANLVDQTKKLTLSEADYQRWALDEEIKGLREYASASQYNADQVTAYRKAKLEEIARAETESARQVQEQVDAIRKRSALPLGRFDKSRSDIDTQYQSDMRSVEQQVANRARTPAQAATLQSELAAARARELAEVNLQASNDITAGWSRGMNDVLDNMQSGFERAKQLATETASAMSDSFGDFFFDAMQGKLDSFGDYMKSFLTSIQRALSNVMGQMATQYAISSIGSLGLSLPKLADGGLVTRPTVAIVGESGPEAVIPLSQASSIGGQSVSVKVNVINQTGTQVTASTSQPRFDAGEWVLDVVLDGVARNRKGLRTALQGA